MVASLVLIVLSDFQAQGLSALTFRAGFIKIANIGQLVAVTVHLLATYRSTRLLSFKTIAC